MIFPKNSVCVYGWRLVNVVFPVSITYIDTRKEMKDAKNPSIESQVHLAISTQTHLREAGHLLPAPSSRGEHGAAGPLPAGSLLIFPQGTPVHTH